MAGLWNRIADRGESGDPLSSHLIKAAVYLVARGVFTAAQVKTAFDARMKSPLTVAEINDLNAILTNAATGTATAKLDYLERVDALNIAAEGKLLTSEATWRSEMGIA